MTWLRHAGPQASSLDGDADGAGLVLAGPGVPPARGARRGNGELAAVRGMATHAVAAGQAPAHLVPLLYAAAADRDLPSRARGDEGRMGRPLPAPHPPRADEGPVAGPAT